ncbi:MAG: hypothetical protein IJH55_09380 [Romboutsia sp.]|nr:hypothetical protein [Romboutsia sp.]
MDICGDDRFEIIAKAKAHLLEATNIDMSSKEMEVLDNFLFRCWQMGWLDRYEVAEQTEPIPHDDYIETENDHLEARCLNCANSGSYKCSKCDGEMYFKDEPNSSGKPNNCDEPTWEQVKEYCNKRCLDIVDSAMRKQWYKDEPQYYAEEQREHDILYEPTHDLNDGSM